MTPLADKVTQVSSMTTRQLIELFREAHGDRFDYSKVVFVNASTKITIICPVHGAFTQYPYDHPRTRGCKACGQELTTFSGKYHKEIPGVVYYIYFPTLNMWKIGVTTLGVTERFRNEPLPYRVLEVIQFDLVKDAYNFEIHTLRTFHKFRYKGPKVLREGSTELLTIDILDFINNKLKEG